MIGPGRALCARLACSSATGAASSSLSNCFALRRWSRPHLDGGMLHGCQQCNSLASLS